MNTIALNYNANANLPWKELAGGLFDVVFNNKAVEDVCANADPEVKRMVGNMVYIAKGIGMVVMIGAGCFKIVKLARI